MGSITSFGEQDVLKCETDDPLSTGFGAYISTWPVAASRPPLRMALLATTAAPVQCRLPVSFADAARCASVMADHAAGDPPWSSRFSM
jgi:hypothetical protein